MAHSLLILPGDGIGPEIMAEVRKVVGWFDRNGIAFEIEEGLCGGCAYDAHGVPITDETMAKAQAADAVLLGAVGGPQYDTIDFALRPERALLRLRKVIDRCANLRSSIWVDALAHCSSRAREVVPGLDIQYVRRVTSGVYYGEPGGVSMEGAERVVIDTHRYTEGEIGRVGRSAFEL